MSWTFIATELFAYAVGVLFIVQAKRRHRLLILLTACFVRSSKNSPAAYIR